ncbi:diphthine synthase [Verticillium alfalfae VaMs.102]|uniref:diphthine methyl ester synthase n=1 Tax=Verticillium alfalfae (strain VaMs.102 / ATCC MYA-4576 / FGSC 10136) TaxID=526221 RepID=C9S986_VERA1|nr:diphthine synthase [Verticillium alfalfae VaMs.102]EEY14989.1 diphthine synthase [Verticillium alfalfae VaMs.102]
MLYLVGLGLSDETDITVKGLEVVKKASRVYLEAYTSILLVDQTILEAYYGRPIVVADRDMVESNSDEILRDAQTEDVAFLVVGDPFGATTHTDIVLRARELEIPVATVPNASIMSSIGAAGLQLLQTLARPVLPWSFFHRQLAARVPFYDRVKGRNRQNRPCNTPPWLARPSRVKEAEAFEEILIPPARPRSTRARPRLHDRLGQCARQMLRD